MHRPLLLLLLLSAPALAQNTQRVMDEALKPAPIAENLRVLTDEIGGRVPGTPAAQRGIQWAIDAFRAAGADTVTTEPVPLKVSWAEGDTRADIVSPSRFRARAISMPWTPATRRPIHARVVSVGMGDAASLAAAGDFSGAILLVDSPVLKTWEELFAEYVRVPPILDAAVKGRAAAIAWTSSRERSLLYRHINTKGNALEPLPMVLLAREDAHRIRRTLEAGKPVTMELSTPNKIGGPIQTSNVIAELRGSEKPDQFVILGAHLDSWDLGTGALDNGANSALVVDALRAIKASGIRPRRSIRFILWGAEEQGLLGSRAYAQSHRSELDKMSAILIFDGGIGAVTGYSLGGRKDVLDRVNAVTAPLASLGVTNNTTDASVGTDHVDFLLEGVPTLVANQEVANYTDNYHASSDTLDKIDIGQLKKHVAIAAATALGIADLPELLGPRQSRAEIETLLKETGLEVQLKGFGEWDDWASGARGRQK